MPFRFNAKNVFLTYPQCNLEKEFALEHFKIIFPNGFKHTIARERHADGGFHLHVLLCFNTKFSTRDERYFDIATHHPNIQPSRSVKNTNNYIKKDGDFITDIPETGGWLAALSASSREDFMEACKEASARDYVLQYDRIVSFADKHFAPPKQEFSSFETTTFINVPQAMTDWVRDELYSPKNKLERRISLILYGPSRIGKTCWARSLTTSHVYWNSQINSTDYINQRLVIFDDFDWKCLPYKKQFLGGQQCFTISDKYRPKRNIVFNGVCIVLANEFENDWRTDWYIKNTIVIEIKDSLF